MNSETDKFALEELEALAQAYLECRLSKFQEKELELILLSEDNPSGLHSPILDEVRETMKFTSLLAEEAPLKPKHNRFWKLRFRWIEAVACIALIIGIALHFTIPGDEVTPHSNTCIEVYSNGRCLPPDEAEKKAAETQKLCMELLNKTVSNAQEAEKQSMRLINQTN